MIGYINNTETFGSVDGPGIRFIFFLQGCRLRCKYCHNPETWGICQDPEQAAKLGCTAMTAEAAYAKARRYRTYWKKDGGITVSGGEPLLQMGFVTELFTRAKGDGVSTCLDTAGEPFSMEKEYLEEFDKLLAVTDLFLLDLKAFTEEDHIALTGRSNKNILKLAKYLSDRRKPVWIRHVLVPGINDNKEKLEELHSFISTLENVERVEVLPYHGMAIEKYEKLGIPYSLKDTKSPTAEMVKMANDALRTAEYTDYRKSGQKVS